MPIAKLVSSDGPIDIYYELHGAVQTARDDFSSSPAAQEQQQQRALDEASEADPALQRVKHAVDDAAAADATADAGRTAIVHGGAPAAEGSGMQDESGASSACSGQAIAAPLLKPGRNHHESPAHVEIRMPYEHANCAAAAEGRWGRHMWLTCCHWMRGHASCSALGTDLHACSSGMGPCGSSAGDQPCRNVLFICGMSARGRTEFFQPIMQHLCSLSGPDGRPLLTYAH